MERQRSYLRRTCLEAGRLRGAIFRDRWEEPGSFSWVDFGRSGRPVYDIATYRSEVHREVTPVKPRVGHHMAKWIGSAVSQRVLFATQNLGTDLPVFEFKCPRLQCLMIREQRSHSPCRAFLAGHIPPGLAGWGETIPAFLSQ